MDLIEKLQKLSELAKRGIGGEKENAEILLKKLMKKHHITEEDLQLKIKNWYKFHVDSELETFYTAFIYKNNIFPEDVPKSNDTNNNMEEVFKIQGYMSNIKRSNVRKAIGLSENE